tara:strand:+ start:3680 stop:4411 length:732 start_codon:yes stop_codon:yes gene_type:complete
MEYKVMDFQKYTDYIGDRWDDTIEMGKFDTYEIALEQMGIIEQDLETGKNGLPKDSTLELIQFVTESHHTGGNKYSEDGWIIVLHKPDIVTDDTNVTDGSEVGNQAHKEQEVNRSISHSEQRDIDLSKLDIEDDIFPPKKGTDEDSNSPNFGRGQHPNSKKNLKPFPKGESGNPSGKPKKVEQLKEYLDWWGNLSDWDNYSWEEYTNREMVIKGIWKRASNGNRQDLDILLSLGLLDSEKFKK